MDVAHYLLTRFDYPAGYQHLEERLELFLSLTLPTVEAQENRDFLWIVKSRNPMVVRALTGASDLLQVQRDFEVPGESEWVITTRLDNDDFVSPQFMADIRAAALPQLEVLDCPGYRYCHRTGRVVLRDHYGLPNPSPFISLVERRDQMQGVYCHWHNRMSQHFPVRRLQRRNWVQTIHQRNKLMTWDSKVDVRLIDTPEWFPPAARQR